MLKTLLRASLKASNLGEVRSFFDSRPAELAAFSAGLLAREWHRPSMGAGWPREYLLDNGQYPTVRGHRRLVAAVYGGGKPTPPVTPPGHIKRTN